MAVPSVAARNARLDELASAIQDWAQTKRTYYMDQVALAKSILQGRTGASRLAKSNVDAVSSIVVNQINQFLTGE